MDSDSHKRLVARRVEQQQHYALGNIERRIVSARPGGANNWRPAHPGFGIDVAKSVVVVATIINVGLGLMLLTMTTGYRARQLSERRRSAAADHRRAEAILRVVCRPRGR